MRMRLIAFLTVLPALGLPAATLVVGGIGGDGRFTEIQAAMDAAADGDTVLVEPGEYVITAPITFRGKAITVRSTDGPEDTVIRRVVDPQDGERGSVVVFENKETAASVLDGFTLTGGWGTKFPGSGEFGGGGGVACFESSPTITNCIITGNMAVRGGGLFFGRSSARITNCKISGNRGDRGGGGVACYEASPVLTDCTISGNCTDVGSIEGGGGVLCRGGSSPVLVNCTISGNYAGSFGGGVSCYASSPTLMDCAITGNTARVNGGGVYVFGNSSPTLTHCAISGNAAGLLGSPRTDNGGGGVYVYDSSLTLTHCTISGNSTIILGGGGVYGGGGSSMTLTNCIVWGNAGGSWTISENVPQEDIAVTFSCIETEHVWPGVGNINSDPLFCGYPGPAETFVDAARVENGNGTRESPFRDLSAALAYRLLLKSNSPCIGTGRDGANMGADLGVCEAGEPLTPMVHMARGIYSMAGVSLVHGASILGAGADETVLVGTIWGLRSGASLTRVTVTEGDNGGIVIPAGESPRIEESTISGNTGYIYSSIWGGAVSCGAYSAPSLTNVTISGNSGTGVYCALFSSVSLTGCSILDNEGLGVSGYGFTLTNCTISANLGRGVNGRDAVLTDSRISGNLGAGVYCTGSFTLTGCTITGNVGRGVVIGESCSLTMTHCTISGNTYGGVWSSKAQAVLTHCTISGNMATKGGGLYCSLGSSLTLINCIIFGNSASDGGAVYCETNVVPILVNCTIAGNWAHGVGGGGVHCEGKALARLINCIVWGNEPESVCGELLHCLVDRDPMFMDNGVLDFHRMPLVVLGGLEYAVPDFIVEPPDYRLRPSSPAIDAGTCANAPATDMGGAPRPQGMGCDIGAYEYPGPVAVPFVRGDANGDGRVNISDAVRVLEFLFAGRKAPSCLKSADATGDGAVNIADPVHLLSYLFRGEPVLPAPFPECGFADTADPLSCERHEPCEG